LYWDNTNNRLGINTTPLSYSLEVDGIALFNKNSTTNPSIRFGGNNPTLPATGFGGALGYNFSVGLQAVDYWNTNPNAIFSHAWFQLTSASTYIRLAFLWPNGDFQASGGIFTYLSTSTSTSTTPTLSFNASNTSVAKGDSIANSYVQDIIQNKSATSGASSNYVVSPDNGTDSTYYGEFGINSSAFSSGTPSDFFSLNNGVYFSGHDGDIAVGSGNGYKLYFPWGATPNNAHVLNASGALGFTTNLGTTLANSGTVGFGTSGQALITAGSGAAPAWGNVASPYSAAPLFGTGADGAVTISSGTTTLTRDMHYTNLTMSGSGVLKTAGNRVFVSGTLDLSAAVAGALQMNGNAGTAASGATLGAGGTGSPIIGSTMQGPNGGAGSTATTAAGTAGSAAQTIINIQAQAGGGGAGGAGGIGINAAGSGGAPNGGGFAYAYTLPTIFQTFAVYNSGNLYQPVAAGAGGGGGAGGGDVTNAGGGGGGGGGAPASLQIFARFIQRGTNSTVGVIQNKGANGGNGGNSSAGVTGGGAGGGASGGGFVYIVAESLLGSVITNGIDVSGGTGGTGGNGFSTGKGGNGGNGGNGGGVQVLVLNVPSYTASTFNAAGTAGSTTTTSTGAAGGAGATVLGNL
jgi:hypothetical protein